MISLSKTLYLSINKTSYTIEVIFYGEIDIDDCGKKQYDLSDDYTIESITEDESLESLDLDNIHADFYDGINDWMEKHYNKLIKELKYEEED